MTREEAMALAERVEREAASITLEAEVAAALRLLPAAAPDWLRRWEIIKAEGGRVFAMHSDGRKGANWLPPKLLTSLDAVKTLETGAWEIDVTVCSLKPERAQVYITAVGKEEESPIATSDVSGDHAEPRARLAAILRATGSERT